MRDMYTTEGRVRPTGTVYSFALVDGTLPSSAIPPDPHSCVWARTSIRLPTWMRCERQSGQPAARRHCHSPVNVLHVTFKAEWQCNRYDRGRVAVKGWGLGTPGAEWQCDRYARGRVAVKGWGLGTLGAEWQCDVHCRSMVNVPHVTFRVEWQCGLAGPAVQTPEKPLKLLGSRHRHSPVTP